MGIPDPAPSEQVMALTERIKTLEESLANLYSDLDFLQKQINHLQARPPLTAFRLPREMTLCGEKIPFEDRPIWENLDREFILSMDNHAQILLWIKRARRYLPYGFSLEDQALYAPLSLERVQIELKQPLPMVEVARAIGSYYKEVKEMNLHFPDEAIPAGIHVINLPSGASGRFWSFFNQWKKEAGEKK